ncbi:MAG: glutamate--cysteine ligase [Gammaproteobacteria bacterium]|jgi:hypothetical protein|nr:glutamate--cysteine ligase [Gammaproteobacteria bacterium]
MGQEIDTPDFTPADVAEFRQRLAEETRLLADWLSSGALPAGPKVGGFELEAWLVGSDLRPLPRAPDLLARLADPLVVPELATFNLEFNGTPQVLAGSALSTMAAELATTWEHAQTFAMGLGARLAMVGILPTVRPEDLILDHMSPRNRYRILNAELSALRGHQPLRLDIQGRDRLVLTREDVMAESATTSFQIHLRVPPPEAARVYNLSKILSAPLVAVGANSPYLFGRDLWRETRIPLFEQTCAMGDSGLRERVSFGLGYVKASILECFAANLAAYPVILPELHDEPPERLAHLRLHNGTIWRWNRPLIGFNPDGSPHLRIEQRVVPAGPTVPDLIATAALYFGAIQDLLAEADPTGALIPFPVAQSNFYAAARLGLEAKLRWLDGRPATARTILTQDLLPRARRGLRVLGIDDDEIDTWLGIIAARLGTGQTGAEWQRAWVERHPDQDMAGLLQAYLDQQHRGRPVHEWPL